MDFDKILISLGEFGTWQRRNNLLLWLPLIGSGMNVLIASFSVMAPRYGFRCRTECDGPEFSWEVPGLSPEEMFPSLDRNSSEYDPDSPNYCRHYKAVPQGDSCYFNTSHVVQCHKGDDFVYQPFEMESTVITANNMACGLGFIGGETLYELGFLVGAIVVGILADKLGRRLSLLISLVCLSLGNLLGPAMPDYWSWSVFSMLSSAGAQGVLLVTSVMVMEYSAQGTPVFSSITWRTLIQETFPASSSI